ncbi:MAG: hypothetical protein NVSMB6_25740 [Burkholderiaceae bacterium]
MHAASAAVQLAADVRRALFEAVAARQVSLHAEQVQTAVQASAEQAVRMLKVGNWNRLDQARQNTFYAGNPRRKLPESIIRKSPPASS